MSQADINELAAQSDFTKRTLLQELEGIEAALCAEWLREDSSGKHLEPLIARMSRTILAAGGDSLWPQIQQLGERQREARRGFGS